MSRFSGVCKQKYLLGRQGRQSDRHQERPSRHLWPRIHHCLHGARDPWVNSWWHFCWIFFLLQPETFRSMRSWKKTKQTKCQESWIFRALGSTNMLEHFLNLLRAVTMVQTVSKEFQFSEFWNPRLKSHLIWCLESHFSNEICFFRATFFQSHRARVSSGRSLFQTEREPMIKKQGGRPRTRTTT